MGRSKGPELRGGMTILQQEKYKSLGMLQHQKKGSAENTAGGERS